MELKNLYFQYDIGDKSFGSFSYNFGIISEEDSRDKIAEKMKFSLKSIEHILDSIYPKPKFDKIETGKITDSEVEAGYSYKLKRTWWDNFNSRIFLSPNTNLEYIISIESDGKPKKLRMRLYNNDSDNKRKFEVYDSILAIPGLNLSEDASNQIAQVNLLRQAEFDIQKYLSLPAVR